MAETPVRPAHTADFTFRAGEFAPDVLKVTEFEGREGLSELFHFRVMLCSDEADITLGDVVGKPALLEISGPSGLRYVNGIVRGFERTGEGSSLTYYAAEIVPVHWLLTNRYRSRLFLETNCSDMSVPGIIRKVFADAGIPEDSYRFALQGTYAAREMVVQYRESEAAFISRLMEHEGIFYFFEHTADGHKMVIADSDVAHVDTPNEAEFPFRSPVGLVPDQEHEVVYRLLDREEIRTGAVTLDDFNFQQPKTQLRASSAGDVFSSLDYVDYPGDYVDRTVGEHYVQLRLEEFQAARRTQQMAATARGLLPGYKFTLIEHPTEALNREYLVTGLTHRATQPQSAEAEGGERGLRYEAQVLAIPSDVPYRPPRRTPRPTVRGSQTAIVVGPSGEEIYTDEYGRVKVQFHWDQEGAYDENSSFWVRVSQGLAGGQYGIMFLPRVGQEVIVDFLEGDPDKPIVTGRVYNNDHMPPYTLPDEKTKSCIKTNSSKGGDGTNELRFEDKAGSEQILLYAQKDLHVRVNNDRVENVDHNHYLTVKEHKFELVKQKKHTEVKLDFNEKVGGNQSLDVVGDVADKIGGKHSEDTTGDIYLKSGANIIIEAGSALTLKAGGNFVKIDASGVTVLGTQVKLNSGGSAGTGSAASLTAPEATVAADAATPGHDTTYQAEAAPPEAIELEEATAAAEEEEEEQQTSWIEIELVDEAGQPVAGERYEITRPDGEVRRGRLDRAGQAHVSLPEPGTCQISFIDLDAEAWERAGEQSAASAAAGAADERSAVSDDQSQASSQPSTSGGAGDEQAAGGAEASASDSGDADDHE